MGSVRRATAGDKAAASGMRPLSRLALAATLLMAAGIVYNTLIAGAVRPGQQRLAQPAPGATTMMSVDAGGGAVPVITLRYDPVVEAVQRELASAGYYRGPVDGVAGKRTRQAIIAYEEQNAMPPTGKATQTLADHIRFTREVARAAEFTGSLPSADSGAAPDTATAADGIRRLETGLAELGYAPGPADGELDDRTADAIRAFERDRGLGETGAAGPAVMLELAKMSGDSETLEQ